MHIVAGHLHWSDLKMRSSGYAMFSQYYIRTTNKSQAEQQQNHHPTVVLANLKSCFGFNANSSAKVSWHYYGSLGHFNSSSHSGTRENIHLRVDDRSTVDPRLIQLHWWCRWWWQEEKYTNTFRFRAKAHKSDHSNTEWDEDDTVYGFFRNQYSRGKSSRSLLILFRLMESRTLKLQLLRLYRLQIKLLTIFTPKLSFIHFPITDSESTIIVRVLHKPCSPSFSSVHRNSCRPYGVVHYRVTPQ